MNDQKNGQKSRNINRVVTHERPHFDEILGIFIAYEYGEEKWPGIRQSPIEFASIGEWTADQVKRFEKDGALIIGVPGPGSALDEHPNEKTGRKKGKCAATLVAEVLGVKDDSTLRNLLRLAEANDLRGEVDTYAQMIMAKYDVDPDPMVTIKWALEGIRALYERQVRFLSMETAEEFKRGKVEVIKGPRGDLTLFSLDGYTNNLIGTFARSKRGCKAAVVVIKNQTGGVQILFNEGLGLLPNMKEIAKVWRFLEQEANGKIETDNWRTLEQEGTVPGCTNIFVTPEGKILNQSQSQPNTPPTKVKFEVIVQFVKICLDPNMFEPSHTECKNGKCDRSCGWYDLGLRKCGAVRKLEYESSRGR